MSTTVTALPRFSINGNEIDPNNPQFQAVDAARTDYIIIQPRHPLSDAEKDELKRLKVEIQGVVARNTLLCKYIPADIEILRQCTFVQYVDVYRNLCVINPSLRQNHPPISSAPTQPPDVDTGESSLLESSENSSTEPHLTEVDIVLHKDVKTNDETVLAKIAEKAGIPQSSFSISPYLIQMSVSSDRLESLAKLDEVSRIEEVWPIGIHDAYAERIMHSDVVLNSTGLNGEDQIIAVADTGFDNGTIKDCHTGFRGKILTLLSVWRKDKANSVNDPYNHGTHVCGSIVAEGESSTTGEKIRGIAPGAKIVVQSLCTADTYIKRPKDLVALLDAAHINCKASVHTNSWGPSWSIERGQPGYTEECKILDNYIRHHPDLVVCWSAGNDGQQSSPNSKGQIGLYAASKNVITVGSTVSDRPFNPQLSGAVASLAAIEQGIDVNIVAYNSSRGPTLSDGRIKPDVVAPGVRILSATSQDPDWQKQLDSSNPHDKLWETMSGTSMATPQVAGCVAIIKQALKKHKIDTRSMDVIKALLVNGAVSLKTTPNNEEGFGRVNLENSLAIPGLTPHAGIFTHTGLTTGKAATLAIEVPTYEQMLIDVPNSKSNPLKNLTLNATLVYSDHESDGLVNELSFVIVASNGTECHGNKSPGVQELDRVNNVQKITWKGIPIGLAQVTVTAHNVPMPGDIQPCAVVWRLTT